MAEARERGPDPKVTQLVGGSHRHDRRLGVPFVGVGDQTLPCGFARQLIRPSPCELNVEVVIHDIGGCRGLSADRSPSTLRPGVQDVKDRFELSSVRRGITAMCPSLRFVR